MVSEESLKLANELANERWEYFKKRVVATVPSFYPQYFDSLCTSQEHAQKTEENVHKCAKPCAKEAITNQAGGMYNDAMMKHMRPEHDFRKESDKGPICDLCAKWVTSRGDGHENNCLKFGKSVWGDYGRDCGLGVVRPRSSVVPWVSQ